jgi:hypothetical protein
MAVHCNVCCDRLVDATENYGGFQVTLHFKGWNQEPGKKAMIEDTCASCYRILAEAVTTAANAIVLKHNAAHDRLHAELHAQRQREADFAKAEAEFRASYRARS